MTRRLVLAQLPRTASGSLHAAFASVGVEVLPLDTAQHAAAAADAGAVVCAVLREPVDRLQSYFNLRLRSGRPHRPSTWSDSEATVFSVIRSFEAWCAALSTEEPWLQSVAERMMLTFSEGYGSLHTFHTEPGHREVRVVGTTADLSDAVARIAALVECDTPVLPADPAVVDATPDSLRVTLDPSAQATIDRYMRDEITLYRALVERDLS